MAILSCYGTTALIGLLSLLGLSLAFDDRIWAGAISGFAVLATVAITISYRRHRIVAPAVIAALGLGLILWAMYGSYSRAIELVGFALLAAATLWDWRAGVRRQATTGDVSWIEAGNLADRIAHESGSIIVDVRGPDEFHGELGHLRGARNIPIDELQRRISELTEFKDCELTLVCRTQMRSAKAASVLKSAGFHDVRVLRGGMEQWNKNSLPVAHQDVAVQA
ncbi:MAG: MerC family mercury resistance protein [Dongiaceae bacterium]